MYIPILLFLSGITIGSCGREAIFGGTLALPGQFPYNVYWEANGEYACGGTLISKRHVLTANHCIERCMTAPCDAIVYTGSVNRERGGAKYRVKKMYAHPNYTGVEAGGVHCDMAILLLYREVQLTPFVDIVKLPTRQHNAGEMMTIVGFGATGLTFMSVVESKYMRMYRAPLINRNMCYSLHSKIYGKKVTAGQICTFAKRGTGTCFGDSGSSVLSEDRELVGVVSYGDPCANGIPDAHTEVFYHLDFIKDILGREADLL